MPVFLGLLVANLLGLGDRSASVGHVALAAVAAVAIAAVVHGERRRRRMLRRVVERNRPASPS